MTTADLATCADYQSLLRGVLEDPADDLPRLVLADWLEENGDGDRAEFVRLQIELAALLALPCSYAAGTWESEGEPMTSGGKPMIAWPNSPPARCVMPKSESFGGGLCHKCARVAAIYPRRQELLAGVKSGHNWRHWAGVAVDAVPPKASYTDHLTFARGFVSAVALTQAAFVGGVCRLCDRGYVRAGPESHWCRTCNGTGQTPGLAAALFAAHPITAVTLSDRAPHADAVIGGYFWVNAAHGLAPDGAAKLHPALFNRLPDAGFVAFPLLAAARSALSAACVAYGRDLAGLKSFPARPDAVG